MPTAPTAARPRTSSQPYILATAFLSLFAIVGFALYGLPFFYDFFSKEFGWSRTVVTSGNALGKLLVAPLFGFIAGWFIDRYGPRKMLMTGALLTGTALIGLSLMNSLGFFYLFYVFNALGYVFGGPLPCQVLISRWFTTNRGFDRIVPSKNANRKTRNAGCLARLQPVMLPFHDIDSHSDLTSDLLNY